MQRIRFTLLAGLAPALAGLLALAGCSSDNKGNSTTSEAQTTEAGKEKAAEGGGSAVPTEEVASTGWGSLKGKVTYKGTPPEAKDLEMIKDKDYCVKGDTKSQAWKIGTPDKGVANVVVWLRAPKGKYFKIPDKDKSRDGETIKLSQPFCAFEPHVAVLYPSYYDAASKKQKETKQVFKVVNDATITHNTNWKPVTNPLLNPSGNPLLQPGQESPIPFKACKDKEAGGEQLIQFACNIHSWMNGFARVFDHPFVAVTMGDKKEDKDQFGNYEIANAPAGVELDLVYWHEALGEPIVKQKVTLKEGENPPINFEISP